MSDEPTPRPWHHRKADTSGDYTEEWFVYGENEDEGHIAAVVTEADAELIVRAVNEYDESTGPKLSALIRKQRDELAEALRGLLVYSQYLMDGGALSHVEKAEAVLKSIEN